jgi:hypothetical protein
MQYDDAEKRAKAFDLELKSFELSVRLAKCLAFNGIFSIVSG